MRVVLVLVWLGFAATCGVAHAATVTANGHYECLWWSADQMAHFDPNRPPARKTRITLDRWEYSDPVGVPNPDAVILVVTITSDTARTLDVSVFTQWSGGLPVRGQTRRWRNIGLAAGIPRNLEVVISVRSAIYERHPKRLRSSISVDRRELGHVDLPIVAGD